MAPIDLVDSYVTLVVSGCLIGGSLGCLLATVGSCSGCTLDLEGLVAPVVAVAPW